MRMICASGAKCREPGNASEEQLQTVHGTDERPRRSRHAGVGGKVRLRNGVYDQLAENGIDGVDEYA